MKAFALLACIAVLSTPAFADNLTNKDGKVFRDIRVISEHASVYGIAIEHKAGTAKIRFSEMTDSDKKKYGYDEPAVAEYEAKQKERKAIEDSKPKPKVVKYFDNDGNFIESTLVGMEVATIKKLLRSDKEPILLKSNEYGAIYRYPCSYRQNHEQIFVTLEFSVVDGKIKEFSKRNATNGHERHYNPAVYK